MPPTAIVFIQLGPIEIPVVRGSAVLTLEKAGKRRIVVQSAPVTTELMESVIDLAGPDDGTESDRAQDGTLMGSKPTVDVIGAAIVAGLPAPMPSELVVGEIPYYHWTEPVTLDPRFRHILNITIKEI